MNICMLVLNKFTHDTRVYKEARSLTESGHKVTLWALGDDQLPAEERVDGFEVKRLSPRSLSLGLRPPGMVYAEIFSRFAYHLCRERADVYHANDANALFPCYLASRMRGAALVYDSHEFWPSAEGKNRRTRLRLAVWKRIERFASRRADAVITVNSAIAQRLRELYGFDPVVVMNCQDYTAPVESDILRRELEIPESVRIAIYAGSWCDGRGLEKLIATAPYMDNIVIVIMGNDYLNGKLQKLASELGVEDRVRFRAAVPMEEVHRYVCSADVGLMPTQAGKESYYLSTENKLFHYIMAGIPTAASDHPEKRRIIDTYRVGRVFDETDPKSIAQTLSEILDDEEEYRRLCRNARRAAREELNWAKEERKLLDLYHSLAGDDKSICWS